MPDYNIRLEYEIPANADNGDMLIETFKTFHPGAGGADNGHADVWLTVAGVDAYDVTQIATALAAKVNRPLIAIEILPTADFDRREVNIPMPVLIGAEEAADLLGITRQAVSLKFNAGELPGQRVGERTIVFARRDVEAAAAKRGAASA